MKKTILSIVLAFFAPALFAADGKAEFSIYGGGNHVNNGGGNHGIWGANIGYGITSRVTLLGEFDHTRFTNSNMVDYLGGLKYALVPSEKVEPYVMLGFGGAHTTNNTDPTLHIGGGARLFVNSKWGIVPEVRWVRLFNAFGDTNTVRYTGGVFFQW
jgi:hypothetical protein